MQVYVLLFKIDNIDAVRVFTDLQSASAYARSINGYKTMFIETVDRGKNESKSTATISQMKCPKCGKDMTPCDRHMECIYCGYEE